MNNPQVEKKLEEKQEAAKASPMVVPGKGSCHLVIPQTWLVVDCN